MELRHLVTFQKAAALLSFTRAAQELNYAQSSVTSQIRALEDSLGVELFDRIGGKIRLTEAGERLLVYADQILTLTEEARSDVTGSNEPAGTLVIGTMESITSYRIPPLLEFFHHRYPRLQLSMRPSLCAETRHALRHGTFDIGFLMEQETVHPGLSSVVLLEEPLVLIAAPSHPLAAAASVTLADLASTALLATETGCAYRDLFEEQFDEPVSFLEFGTIEAIKRGVMAGLGVALLPEITVRQEVERKEIAVLPWKVPFAVHTQLAWRQGKRLTREMQLFIDHTLSLVAQEPRLRGGG
mgnify:CR=1 FL=1|jgi:DNA-binding transcriptional LysR family regulator